MCLARLHRQSISLLPEISSRPSPLARSVPRDGRRGPLLWLLPIAFGLNAEWIVSLPFAACPVYPAPPNVSVANEVVQKSLESLEAARVGRRAELAENRGGFTQPGCHSLEPLATHRLACALRGSARGVRIEY
jgi:hypothetical protein